MASTRRGCITAGPLVGWSASRVAATARQGILPKANSFPNGLLQPAIGGRAKIEMTIAALTSVARIMD